MIMNKMSIIKVTELFNDWYSGFNDWYSGWLQYIPHPRETHNELSQYYFPCTASPWSHMHTSYDKSITFSRNLFIFRPPFWTSGHLLSCLDSYQWSVIFGNGFICFFDQENVGLAIEIRSLAVLEVENMGKIHFR